LRGKVKQSQGAGDAHSLTSRNLNNDLAFVNQNQVGVEERGQGDRGGFTLIERRRPRTGRLHNLQPVRRASDPCAHRCGSTDVAQFFLHGGRKDYPLKEARKQIDVTDQD